MLPDSGDFQPGIAASAMVLNLWSRVAEVRAAKHRRHGCNVIRCNER